MMMGVFRSTLRFLPVCLFTWNNDLSYLYHTYLYATSTNRRDAIRTLSTYRQADSITSYTEVQERIDCLADGEEAGHFSRPNALGIARLNEMLFSRTSGRLGTGCTVATSRRVMPRIRSALSQVDTEALREMISVFLRKTPEITLRTLTELTVRLLWTTSLCRGGQPPDAVVQAIVDTQAMALRVSLLPTWIPTRVRYWVARTFFRFDMVQHARTLAMRAVVAQGGYTDEQAMGIVDMLYFAGGLSIPLVVSSGLSILYAKQSPMVVDLQTMDVESFVLETIRRFPPVRRMSYHDHRTDRPIDLELLTALHDPSEWGEESFTIRPKEDYMPRMRLAFGNAPERPIDTHQRGCPATRLSLVILRLFFEQFVAQQDQWHMPNDDIRFEMRVKGFERVSRR